MPQRLRITGLQAGAVDLDNREIQFDLRTSSGKELQCVGRYGPIAQVIGALAAMHMKLAAYLQTQNAMEATPAEEIASSLIHKEKWSDKVLVVLTTTLGVPHTFALPCAVAADIGEQLKTESAKPTNTGNA